MKKTTAPHIYLMKKLKAKANMVGDEPFALLKYLAKHPLWTFRYEYLYRKSVAKVLIRMVTSRSPDFLAYREMKVVNEMTDKWFKEAFSG